MRNFRKKRRNAKRKEAKTLSAEEKTTIPEEELETAPETEEGQAAPTETVEAEPEPVEGEAVTEEPEEDEKDKKIAELTDQYRRTMAEFDNFRKRSDKEKAARFDMGIRSVAERILPVVDNFERGLGTLTKEQKAEGFAAGMLQTYRQLVETLEQIGIVPIEAVGKPFNPDLHNAVMHVEDETVDENTVVEEFQKGYTYNGSVVRYSMVKVAN